jgi:hypothetical protein
MVNFNCKPFHAFFVSWYNHLSHRMYNICYTYMLFIHDVYQRLFSPVMAITVPAIHNAITIYRMSIQMPLMLHTSSYKPSALVKNQINTQFIII